MKALVIDDEPMPARSLVSMINRLCHEINSTDISFSASDALILVSEKEYDVIFIDIEMPEMTGFDFIKYAALHSSTKYIVTTAYEQYAIEAFNMNATHYLVKPIKENDLINAIRKVGWELKRDSKPSIKKENIISVFNDHEHHLIKESDIIRLEADGSYTTFLLKEGKILSSKSIGFYEKKLPLLTFFRPHKSHIVNLSEVVKLHKGRGGYIVLKNEDIIPLTTSKQEAFEKAIGI